ncbi:MAG: bacillithiol biosynthesis cysteine-adding enzyme BshC [Myxococcota bacterium]
MGPTTLTAAWLAGEDQALRWLPAAFRDPTARRETVARAATRSVHPAVVGAVETRTDAQARNRDQLARTGSVCVVTGQQAGLFGGPLYTLFKAAGAIRHAQVLEATTGTPCVPVFWLQSEDHDFDEIATAAVVDAASERQVIAVPSTLERRRSVGARSIGPAATQAIEQLDRAIRELPHGPTTITRIRKAYAPDQTWTGAFAELMQDLFAPHGLLIVDPRDLRVQQAARPLHEQAVTEAATLAQRARQWSEGLNAAGFVAPIHVRPGAPLSFFHPEGPDGPRYRLEPGPTDDWSLVGTDRTVKDLSTGAFSTSAMLRPILQDRLLPTAAYLGGPGEIAYFAQLPPVYAHFDLPMPLVVPRPRFVIRDPACDRILENWGWSLDRLALPRDELLADLVSVEEGPFEAWQSACNALVDALDRSAPEAKARSKGLGKSVAKTQATVTRAVERLIARYRRALARDNAIAMRRLNRLCDWYVPAGAPQERAQSLPTLVARSGWERVVPALIEAIEPWNGTLRSLALP